MSASSQAVYESRITRLERSLRRTQWGVFGLLIVVVALGLAWYGVGDIAQRQVVAHRIVVVDDSGAIRIGLGQDNKDTRRASRAAGVILYDATGHERGGMSTMEMVELPLAWMLPTCPPGRIRTALA